MTPNDLVRLSPEKFTAFIIAYLKYKGYTLEIYQFAIGGLFLLFQLKGPMYVVHFPSDALLFSPCSDMTWVGVAWGIKSGEDLAAACGYVITRSRISLFYTNIVVLPNVKAQSYRSNH